MHDKVSLWLEDALAAAALIALVYWAPHILALEPAFPEVRPVPECKKAKEDASRYGLIVGRVLTGPTVITVDKVPAASCRTIRSKS